MDLLSSVATDLELDVVGTTRVTGGDFAQAYRFDLADGGALFVKTHRNPPAHFFSTEATGLRWLHDAGSVAVPEVLASSDGDDGRPAYLALSWIDGTGTPRDERVETAFGTELAQLHQAGADHFGRSDRRATGSRALPNEPCTTWPEFYSTQRLGPLVRIAIDESALPSATCRDIEWCAEHLDEFGAHDEPAARLHGDLWAGNRLTDRSGSSWLIDPAVHGGHREFDLAMMRLFGGFGPACFEAYQREAPLADGWLDRVPLHQLAPLMVHAIKFGGSYVAATQDAVRSIRQIVG